MQLNRLLALSFVLTFSLYSQGQITISGRVTGGHDEPASYASVSIEGTYEGTVTDDSGRYSFQTAQKAKFRLGASAMGLETSYTEVDPSAGSRVVEFQLRESVAAISPAVITAGTFAAGEQGKAEIFKPRDMGTTAGTPGDMQATIEALPGTQRIGYSEGLFVRGGSDKESKYIMDGLIYPDPYYSHVPGLKQRGRLDPFLFSGTVFSAGGYSAQYGQALSSVLILNSRGIADSTFSGGGIHSYGGNLFHTHRWKKMSLYVNGSYNNMAPMHSVVRQAVDWTQSPHNADIKLVYRYEPRKNDLLKIYTCFSRTSMGLRFHQPEDTTGLGFQIRNNNEVLNACYTHFFPNNRTSVYTGLSATYDADKVKEGTDHLERSGFLGQGKIVLRHALSNDVRLLAGAEYLHSLLSGSIDTLSSRVSAPLVAAFAESEATVSKKLAVRAGIRSEYSHYGRQTSVMPRISLAWKFTASSQVSLSYGTFYQLPEEMTMLYHPGGLKPEKAVHYIANYQWQANDRTFRAEIYYKQYNNLVTEYQSRENYQGHMGYARGFELFFRDRTTIPNLDSWISFTLTDAKRRTIVPDTLVTPGYVSAVTVSVVSKYWMSRPGMYVSASYHYASPRSFNYSPDNVRYISLPVPAWSSLDMSISKPLQLFNRPSLLFFSLQNIWGTDRLLGYASIPAYADPMHIYRSEKRSFFIGIFISMYNN